MDYLKIKKEIIDLKSSIVLIQLDIRYEIRKQHYEVAASMNFARKKLEAELEEKRKLLVNQLENYRHSNSKASEYLNLLACLQEINIFKAPATNVEEAMKAFCSNLKEEYERLMLQKRECFANLQFKQAGELNEQILAIGLFLARYSK